MITPIKPGDQLYFNNNTLTVVRLVNLEGVKYYSCYYFDAILNRTMPRHVDALDLFKLGLRVN